jgi:hypothetical protein
LRYASTETDLWLFSSSLTECDRRTTDSSDCHEALLRSAAIMLCRRRENGPTGIRQRGNGSIRGSANAANPEACCIDSRANLALLAVVTLAMVLQLFAWPFLLRHWGAQALWLGVPLVVLAPTHWGPIHEAIHGQLLPRRQLSESAGRVLAISFLRIVRPVAAGNDPTRKSLNAVPVCVPPPSQRPTT